MGFTESLAANTKRPRIRKWDAVRDATGEDWPSFLDALHDPTVPATALERTLADEYEVAVSDSTLLEWRRRGLR